MYSTNGWNVTELMFCVTLVSSSSPMIVNTDVSLTMPMNILPMFGIAIFVACGSVIRMNTFSGVMPTARPASR